MGKNGVEWKDVGDWWSILRVENGWNLVILEVKKSVEWEKLSEAAIKLNVDSEKDAEWFSQKSV